MKTILMATEKPFASGAVERIKETIKKHSDYELQLLEKYPDQSVLLNSVEHVDALVVRSDKVDQQLLDRGNSLKIIVRAGTGVDNIDLDAARRKGIVVMNTPGQNSNAVAELALGLILGLIRNKYNGKAGTELRGKCIGMHGFGHVARRMSQMAKGFNMDVWAFDPFLDHKQVALQGVHPCNTLEEMYEHCDFISINLPLNEDTHKTINYELLSKTRDHVLVVNTARKELIDEPDLLRVMKEKSGLRYTSDVAPDCKEEISSSYPDRVLFTSRKMGAQTVEANENAAVAAVQQVIRFFEEGDTHFQVNR